MECFKNKISVAIWMHKCLKIFKNICKIWIPENMKKLVMFIVWHIVYMYEWSGGGGLRMGGESVFVYETSLMVDSEEYFLKVWEEKAKS